MADIVVKCPLCCNKTFPSKILLIEHLANTLAKLYCPICGNKWSSVGHLIEHLNVDNCQPDSYTVQTFNVTTLEGTDENQPGNSTTEDKQHKNGQKAETAIQHTEENQQQTHEVNINDSKMYVELLSKQMLNPCLQTQELKFIQEDGESRYVIIEQPGALSAGSAVLTKQNHDGTISLTTVKDFNMETETLIAPAETQTEDTQEEIYSCNMCGVSFSSVLEHIQNYHNDQEVVVEEPLEESEENLSLNNVLINEKLVVTDPLQIPDPRRVITETGDIVEESVLLKTVSTELLKDNVEKQMRAPKRFVQIDKFCDSIVKDIEPNDEKGGPYHKVIVKEIESSSKKITKMYHCISCNYYVTSLNEFKSRPCKTLKYSCPHCPVAYENSKSLCAHMKVHKGQMEIKSEPTTYECEICCTTFQTNKSLKLHKRMHDPIKARPIEGPVKSEGAAEDRYLCGECKKMIPVEYRTIHQQSHKHKNEMNCTICNKKFHSSEYLEMHMRVHNMDKAPANKADASLPYACLYCSRRFGKPHEKVKHERIHTGEKPHACEICGKSFRVSYCLTLHMRTHTGARPYACDHCGKRFKAHSVYNHHLLTHSDKRAYKCPFCPKAFKTSVQLAGHKNSHTKPFSCQHCNRPFASLYAVRVHMETHARHNNLKFSCQLCGASYARAFALKDHVKHAHQQDVDATDNVTGTTRDDWTILSATEDTEANSVVADKDNDSLSEEVSPLGISANELIVP